MKDPAQLAAQWIGVLTALAIVLICLEEWLIPSNPGFLGVVIVVSIAYIVSPILAGRFYGSSRVARPTKLLGVAGWLFFALVAFLAYHAIGGGP